MWEFCCGVCVVEFMVQDFEEILSLWIVFEQFMVIWVQEWWNEEFVVWFGVIIQVMFDVVFGDIVEVL